MDTDLLLLEKKLLLLFEHARSLRIANETLRRDLVRAREENLALTKRSQVASARLEALMTRLPEKT